MSNQSPYEQLGVSEESSFEEIQATRDRLFAEHQGDRQQLESIETAYDAVLMDRLRMRQEGKIKVPDRIRFPEKVTLSPANPAPSTTNQTPTWLQRLVDTPSQRDIWLPATAFAVLSAFVFYVPSFNSLQAALVIGVGSSFYFLYRKERKLGRAVLLGLVGLIGGFLIGGLIGGVFQAQLAAIGLRTDVLATMITFLVLWLISSFLR